MNKNEHLKQLEKEEAHFREVRKTTIQNSINQIDAGLKRLERIMNYMQNELDRIKQRAPEE